METVDGTPVIIAVGALVIQWGRIEAEINRAIQFMKDPVCADNTPYGWAKRSKAWRKQNLTSASDAHRQSTEQLWADLTEARLIRDVLVHGSVRGVWKDGRTDELEVSLQSEDQRLLKIEYEQVRETFLRIGRIDPSKSARWWVDNWTGNITPRYQIKLLGAMAAETLTDILTRMGSLNNDLYKEFVIDPLRKELGQ